MVSKIECPNCGCTNIFGEEDDKKQLKGDEDE